MSWQEHIQRFKIYLLLATLLAGGYVSFVAYRAATVLAVADQDLDEQIERITQMRRQLNARRNSPAVDVVDESADNDEN